MSQAPPNDRLLRVRPLAVCLGVVFVIALALRVGWTFHRWSKSPGGAGLVFPDERDYWAGAVNLAGGGGLIDADGRRATRMPLYPAFLSLFAGLPNGAWWARVVQAILGSLAAPLIAALAWRLGGRRTGWLAGLLVALDPFSIYFSPLLLTETLTTAALAGFWLLAWPLALPDGRLRTWRWPPAGAILLLLIYLHPTMMGLGIAWAIFVALSARRAGGNFTGLTWGTLLVLVGLAPWCWRNYQLIGDPVVLTTRSGISLFDGQGPQADGSSNLAFTRGLPEDRLPESQWNRSFRNKALRAMWSDPWRVCRLAGVKFCRAWSPLPHAAEAQSPAIVVISAVWTSLMLGLMGLGLWHWRGRPGAWMHLLLPAIYLTCVQMVLVGSIRYRLPAMPMIELLAAVGLGRLIGVIRPGWRPSFPPAEVVPEDHPHVSRFQRWLAVYRYGRRTVPIWRRRLTLALLLVLTLGYYAYQHFTSDERIRQQAINFLTHLTGGQVRIKEARFSFFGGVALSDVMIALPGQVDFDPTARTFEDRQVFAARNLQLRHEPFGLLTGRLKVIEILADEPTVTLVKNPEYPKYAYNWQAMFPSRPQAAKQAQQQLPSITVRNARVKIIEIRDGRRRIEPEIELSALAMPDRHRSGTYRVPWRKFGDQPEQGQLFYRLNAGTYTGDLPTVPVTTLKASLPPRYTEWLETLEVAGQIKPEQIRYDARHGGRSGANISLDRVRLSVPVSSEERPAARAAGRFLRLTDGSGLLELTPTECNAHIRGRLNGAPCEVVAKVVQYSGPIEDMGYDIHVRTQGVRLPDPNDPPGARFIQSIAKVRSFFNDFDPHGRVDVDFHLLKSPGREMGVLLRGTMTALDCDALYKNFPYRCRDVSGRVRFAEDGIWLENLLCHHGSGVVVINGRVDGSNWYDGFDLDIAADNVPLDPALFEAVPEKFRSIWRRFDPVGLANLSMRLKRGTGTPQTGAGPWSTHIVADLVETNARFVDFPYPLNGVTGRLGIDDNRITLSGLRGTHGPASARFDGQAYYGDPAESELEFRLEARDLPLDEDLANALPPDGREAFRQYRPTGRADLLGRVFMPRGGSGMSYGVRAHLRNASACPQSFPCRIDDLQGTLAFTPQVVHLIDIAGRRDSARVTARGRIERRNDGPLTDLTVACDRLALDKGLYEALPAELKKSWNALSPTGAVALTAHVRRGGTGPKQLSTHETILSALGNGIRYKALPIPFDEVRGEVRITDETVELRGVTGRYGPGRVRLEGRIDLVGAEQAGKLSLHAENMPFDDALRQAMPGRVRKSWDNLNPTGAFDLDLSELSYRMSPNQPTHWTYRGRLGLRNASLDLGFQASQVEGSLIGSGTALGDGQNVTIDAAIGLKHIAVNQRELTDVTGRMRRESGSGLLTLEDLAGRTYGGQAVGFGNVEFGAAETRYGLYLVAREMSLGPFLNSTRPKDAPPTQASGIIDARLYLSGVSGRTDSRRGTGEVHIRQAQMYKLPFVLAMLSAINITIPDENAFHDAHASFCLEGKRLNFDTIELKGRSLSMLGSGSMDTETEQLNLTFITGSPHDLPRIPLLIELAQGASRELMEIAITGPLNKPNMQGRSLYSLRTALEALFPPREQTGAPQ